MITNMDMYSSDCCIVLKIIRKDGNPEKRKPPARSKALAENARLG